MAGGIRPETKPETDQEMKTSVLEKPAAPKKSDAPKCATPFHFQASGVPGWLGCPPIWSTPPSYPSRIRCQRDVLPEEFKEATLLVAAFREAEEIAAANDLNARQNKLDDQNPMKKLSPVERQQVQEEIRNCNHAEFLVALQQMREYRDVACDLAKTILGRLVQGFNEELNERAWAAEERLAQDFIPFLNQGNWELHRQPDVVARHAWRELCRNALRYLSHENSIGSIQWLATQEENTPSVPWI